MELMKYPVGTILSIPDHGKMASHAVESRHKYLIIGHSSYRLGMYQCVCITSMYKKEVCYELPIVVNGYVGYIVPYNYHSYSEFELKRATYEGGIEFTEYYSVDQFISLIKLAHAALNGQKESKVAFLDEFDYYCRCFERHHRMLTEFRYVKHHGDGAPKTGSTKYRYVQPEEIRMLQEERKAIKEELLKLPTPDCTAQIFDSRSELREVLISEVERKTAQPSIAVEENKIIGDALEEVVNISDSEHKEEKNVQPVLKVNNKKKSSSTGSKGGRKKYNGKYLKVFPKDNENMKLITENCGRSRCIGLKIIKNSKGLYLYEIIIKMYEKYTTNAIAEATGLTPYYINIALDEAKKASKNDASYTIKSLKKVTEKKLSKEDEDRRRFQVIATHAPSKVAMWSDEYVNDMFQIFSNHEINTILKWEQNRWTSFKSLVDLFSSIKTIHSVRSIK